MSAPSIPSTLVRLGTVLDLRVEANEKRWTLDLQEDWTYWLCADRSMRRLWLVPEPEGEETNVGKKFEALQGVYRTWHDFEPVSATRGRVTLKEPEIIGRVSELGYRSEKWSGREEDYGHRFDTPPRLTRMGDVYRIAGGHLRVESRGVTG